MGLFKKKQPPLVDSTVETPAAQARSLFDSQRYADSLAVLNHTILASEKSERQAELRSLRLRSLIALGRPGEALDDARWLWTTEDPRRWEHIALLVEQANSKDDIAQLVAYYETVLGALERLERADSTSPTPPMSVNELIPILDMVAAPVEAFLLRSDASLALQRPAGATISLWQMVSRLAREALSSFHVWGRSNWRHRFFCLIFARWFAERGQVMRGAILAGLRPHQIPALPIRQREWIVATAPDASSSDQKKAAVAPDRFAEWIDRHLSAYYAAADNSDRSADNLWEGLYASSALRAYLHLHDTYHEQLERCDDAFLRACHKDYDNAVAAYMTVLHTLSDHVRPGRGLLADLVLMQSRVWVAYGRPEFAPLWLSCTVVSLVDAAPATVIGRPPFREVLTRCDDAAAAAGRGDWNGAIVLYCEAVMLACSKDPEFSLTDHRSMLELIERHVRAAEWSAADVLAQELLARIQRHLADPTSTTREPLQGHLVNYLEYLWFKSRDLPSTRNEETLSRGVGLWRATDEVCRVLGDSAIMSTYPEFRELVTRHIHRVSLEPLWLVLRAWARDLDRECESPNVTEALAAALSDATADVCEAANRLDERLCRYSVFMTWKATTLLDLPEAAHVTDSLVSARSAVRDGRIPEARTTYGRLVAIAIEEAAGGYTNIPGTSSVPRMKSLLASCAKRDGLDDLATRIVAALGSDALGSLVDRYRSTGAAVEGWKDRAREIRRALGMLAAADVEADELALAAAYQQLFALLGSEAYQLSPFDWTPLESLATHAKHRGHTAAETRARGMVSSVRTFNDAQGLLDAHSSRSKRDYDKEAIARMSQLMESALRARMSGNQVEERRHYDSIVTMIIDSGPLIEDRIRLLALSARVFRAVGELRVAERAWLAAKQACDTLGETYERFRWYDEIFDDCPSTSLKRSLCDEAIPLLWPMYQHTTATPLGAGDDRIMSILQRFRARREQVER